MPRRIPSLPALRAFEAAARRLSFTNAARELHVSQAAISRQVRVLEADLGRALFRRLHRQVELTVAGKRLANGLRIGFGHILRAVEAARDSPTQRLRISVEPGFAARWLVPRFGRFTARHPDIDVELDSSNELRALGREADIAIRFLRSNSRKPKQSARLLFTYVGFPVIARGKLAGRSAPRRDDDIVPFRLLHDDDGSEWRRWFAAAGLSGFEDARHLYFNDSSLAITAALRGQGVALSGPPYVSSQLSSRRLIRLGRTSLHYGDYWLLETADRGGTRARAAFSEWIDHEMKSVK
jgi:LysR family glycine cleavage system transcriptional activator